MVNKDVWDGVKTVHDLKRYRVRDGDGTAFGWGGDNGSSNELIIPMFRLHSPALHLDNAMKKDCTNILY